MPALGVGGATPFAMRSNHATAFNHSFRDVAAYDPLKQVRVKCPSCGVWARRGAQCYLCRRPVGGYAAPRRNNVRVGDGSVSERPSTASMRRSSSHTSEGHQHATTPRATSQPRSSAPRPTSARPSTARGTSTSSGSHPTAAAAAHSKVKCKSCGCWVTKGKACYLCRTVAPL